MRVTDVEVEHRLERFKTVFKKAGIKLTHQRLEVFREVAASFDHPGADVVFRAVQKRMPTVSLDTVYRTLSLLNELGLVTTLGPRRESVRFDANLEHHHHYLCVRCGLARDFESAELNALRIPKAANRFGEVVSVHVEVRGTCARCTAKVARNPALPKRKRPRARHRRRT